MNTSIRPRLQRKFLQIALINAFAVFLILIISGFKTDPKNPGVVYEIETTDHGQSIPKTESSEMSVHGKMLKMEVLPGRTKGSNQVKDEVIFRGDRRQVIVVNHTDESYFVVDEKMLEMIKGQLQQTQGMLKNIEIPKEVLDQMPEAERKKLEAMMKNEKIGAGGLPEAPQRTKSEFKSTGERATKQGYPCVKYDVLQGGVKLKELWVTDWDNVEGGEEVEDVWKEMAEFFEELFDSIGDDIGEEDPFGGSGGFFEEMKEIDGFPVVTRSFDEEGDLEEESTLRSARRRTLDPADFEPPAGYKRRAMGPW